MAQRTPPSPRIGRPAVLAGLLALATVWAPSIRAQHADAALAVVRQVSYTPLPGGERVSVELSDEVTFRTDRVPDPDRVYFDLDHATVPASVVAATEALTTGSLLKAVRIARHTTDVTRLVLDLSKTPQYSVYRLYDPFRLVIDLKNGGAVAPTDSTAVSRPAAPTAPPAAAASPAPPGPPPSLHRDDDSTSPTTAHVTPAALKTPAPASETSRGNYSLARQLGLGVSRIVIDPGHGGHDPGAQANGISEADLVLDISLRLEKLLEAQRGVDVVLTRRTDEFIPLEERTAIANREGADLFLSIHANASRRTSARGIETYFLNFSTNPAAEAVAARENATSSETMGNLPKLVKTIALNNKVAESRELASMVQSSLVHRLQSRSKGLKNLGVKQAPFVVLIGAQMPSVLAEVSFLTNRSDASLLKQGAYRQRIAQALCDAVMKYQTSLKKVTQVADADHQSQ